MDCLRAPWPWDAVIVDGEACRRIAEHMGLWARDLTPDDPPLVRGADLRTLEIEARYLMQQRDHVGGWPDMRLSLAERRKIYRPPSSLEQPPAPPEQQGLALDLGVAAKTTAKGKGKKAKPEAWGGFEKRTSKRSDLPQVDGGYVAGALGPPRQYRVLVLASSGPAWIDRARDHGMRVDEPFKGLDAETIEQLAARFVAETPAWRVGAEPEEHGYGRDEQLLGFLEPDLESVSSWDELDEGAAGPTVSGQ